MVEYDVGTVEELPVGSKRVVTVNGVEIGVFNVKGTYYALPNHCLHQGGPICEGNVGGTVMATQQSNWEERWVSDGEVVACPWHGMEFNIITGRCVSQRRVRLRQFRVKVVDGLVKVTV